ncbi:uncharacterized protein LOC117072254 [Trachypithecus francoisi]|uniref:uncharacterized protein LOC117072254 n=1 Tax=Trachypithecus francoisi TaxID=54180 RepID=UPI00141AC41B|nr:uncharacterized protein LOC117072254 [Trachypithecus francoisi]
MPVQAQPLPHSALSTPSSCLTVASQSITPACPVSVSQCPLLAHLFLPARLQVHLLPHSNLFGLSSCPAPCGLCRPKTFSSPALQFHCLPVGSLNRSSFCLTVAS